MLVAYFASGFGILRGGHLLSVEGVLIDRRGDDGRQVWTCLSGSGRKASGVVEIKIDLMAAIFLGSPRL